MKALSKAVYFKGMREYKAFKKLNYKQHGTCTKK